MDYTLFIIASSIEYFSLFIFMLTLYRFNVREKLGYIVFVSFIMSQVSYFTRLVPEIGFASSYIQYLLSIIVLVVLFRISIYYSIVMNLTAIAFGIAIQALIIGVVWLGLGISLSEVQDNAVVTAAIQILSSTIFIAAARTVYTYNWGFDFVPPSYRSYRAISRKSSITIAVIGTVFVASCIFAFLFRNEYEDYLIIEGAIFIITLPLFLYYSFVEDKQL